MVLVFWEGQFNTDRPLVPRLERIKAQGFQPKETPNTSANLTLKYPFSSLSSK
jgi:hypothetical protein